MTYRVPRARDGLTWVLSRSGVGPGDEVLIPDLEHASMVRSVLGLGAVPVAYGVRFRELAPSLDYCAAGVTSRCRALVVPHLHGFRTDMAGFRELADSHGLILIEDSAHLVSDLDDSGLDRDAADCTLFSFDYDKPLAVGWGGALALSARLSESLGVPEYEEIIAADDRAAAAVFILWHCLSDAGKAAQRTFSSVDILTCLRGENDEWVDEVLEITHSEDPDRALSAWCDSHLPPLKPSLVTRLSPRTRRTLRRVLPESVHRVADQAGGRKGFSPRPRGVLPSGGFCERILLAQQRLLVEHARRRVGLARIYARGLDPDKMRLPGGRSTLSGQGALMCDCLCFPVALKNSWVRDRIAKHVARDLDMDIWPYMWPTSISRWPGLGRSVRSGPGAKETSRLVEGLINLPVHSQVSEELASELVDLLNGV